MIFSILAFLALIISICIKERKKSLEIQSINCLFEALYAYYIGALTGAYLGIINFIRSRFFMKKDKINPKVYFGLLILFETIVIANCANSWQGLISMVPTVGTIVRTYCLWQSNMELVRLSGMISGICYGYYYAYYQSWFIVLGYIILFFVSLINFYKNDMKNSYIEKGKKLWVEKKENVV